MLEALQTQSSISALVQRDSKKRGQTTKRQLPQSPPPLHWSIRFSTNKAKDITVHKKSLSNKKAGKNRCTASVYNHIYSWWVQKSPALCYCLCHLLFSSLATKNWLIESWVLSCVSKSTIFTRFLTSISQQWLIHPVEGNS